MLRFTALAAVIALAACTTTTTTTTTPDIPATATTPEIPATTTTVTTQDNLFVSTQKFLQKLEDTVLNVPDLTLAIAEANGQTPPDIVMSSCYVGLRDQVKPLVDNLLAGIGSLGGKPGDAPIGIASQFQYLRDLKGNIGVTTALNSQVQMIRVSINTYCGGAFLDAQGNLVDVANLFTGK